MSKEKVLELKEQGKTNRQIARELDVSTQYVWNVLHPEAFKKYQQRYQQTDRYKEASRKRAKEYYKRRKQNERTT